MIIQSSNIQMNAAHFKHEQHTETETLRTFGPNNRLRIISLSSDDKKDRLNLSNEAEAFLADIHEKVKDAHQCDEDEDQGIMSVKEFMVKQIVESVLGQEVKVIRADDFDPDTQTFSDHLQDPSQTTTLEPGVEYIHQETHYEKELLSFNAQGTVQTADGLEISFNVQLEMSREIYSESTIALREGGQPIDPLVINFAGNAAELTSQKFTFDLDADGTMDNISFVKPGSGFLVFDKNRDGVVQDGSELFGPTTGNGFDELAQYDQDQNGWIDENDSIYSLLSIWSKAHDGSDRFQSLKDADVGAIYLSAAKTAFDYKDMGMNTHGILNQSGVYLTDSGQAKLIQQLDLVA